MKVTLGWGSPKDALHLFYHTAASQRLEIILALITRWQRLGGIAGTQDQINVPHRIDQILGHARSSTGSSSLQ